MDIRMATRMGMSGVVFGWQYSVVIWLRLVTTIHSVLPYFWYTCSNTNVRHCDVTNMVSWSL